LTQSTPALKDVAYVNDLAKTPEDVQALNFFIQTDRSVDRLWRPQTWHPMF